MLLKAEGSKNLLQVFLSTIITVILAYFKTCALLRSLRVQNTLGSAPIRRKQERSYLQSKCKVSGLFLRIFLKSVLVIRYSSKYDEQLIKLVLIIARILGILKTIYGLTMYLLL